MYIWGEVMGRNTAVVFLFHKFFPLLNTYIARVRYESRYVKKRYRPGVLATLEDHVRGGLGYWPSDTDISALNST